MIQYTFSSPIIASSIPDKNINSTTELDLSGAEWSGPQNQLGLDPEYLSHFQQVCQPEDQFGFWWDNEALDKKCEINHHEAIVIYWDRVDCAIQVSPEDDLKGEQDDKVVALAKKVRLIIMR